MRSRLHSLRLISPPTPLAISLSVSLGLSLGLTSSLYAQDSSAASAPPRGIYVSSGPTRGERNSVEPRLLARSVARGSLVRIGWAELEPSEGRYVWEALDRQFELARSSKTEIALAVVSGPSAPSWLKAERLRCQGPRGSVELPLPWDEVLLTRWEALIAAVGRRYSSRSELRLVHATHSTANGFEMQLPRRGAWREAGYTVDRYLASWKRVLEAFAKAFPQTPFDFDVHPVLGSPRVAQGLVGWACERFERRCGVLAAWWSEKNAEVYPEMLKLLRRGAKESFAAVQVAGSQARTPTRLGPGGLPASLQLALAEGAHYVEVWNADLRAPELESALEASEGLLRGSKSAALERRLAEAVGEARRELRAGARTSGPRRRR